MPLDIFWIKIFVVGAGSIALGLWLVQYLRSRSAPSPARNAKVRLRVCGTTYQSTFLGTRNGQWALALPLRSELVRPIHNGEFVQILAGHKAGIVVMDTTVRANVGVLLVDSPSKWRVEDRREDLRISDVGHLQTRLDGDRVALEDISPKGARVKLRDELTIGQRVRLDVLGFEESIYGWVLACAKRPDRYIARIRFEEETDMYPILK
jgi:hypothetical protein